MPRKKKDAPPQIVDAPPADATPIEPTLHTKPLPPDAYDRWAKSMKKTKLNNLDRNLAQSVELTLPQKKFVKNVLNGDNYTEAAKNAGFSPITAKQKGHQLMQKPKIIAAIQVAISKAGITPKLLAKRLREGLDATETKTFAFNGKIMDEKEVADFKERREHIELATKLLGATDKENERDGGKDGKVHVSVVLNAIRQERGLK